MKNIPTRIYLQTGLEDNEETCDDFNKLDGISWCSDKIYSDDLEYVSVSFISRRIKELKEKLESVKSTQSKAGYVFTIEQLKSLIE